MFQACEQGDLEVALRLLATDVDVDIKDTVRLMFMVVDTYSTKKKAEKKVPQFDECRSLGSNTDFAACI